jgi:hypothetical protein
MKHKSVCFVFIFSAALAAFSDTQESDVTVPDSAAPYLGQDPPGDEPVLFAPGTVSLPGCSEYSGTFASDGGEYFFYRFSDSMPATIFQCQAVGAKWTDPEPVDFSAAYPAFEPHLTYDNASLYFAWARGSGFPGIWVTSRDSMNWAEPKYAGQGMFVSSDSMGNIYVTDISSLSANGKTYLARVTVDNGVFTDYQRLGISAHYGSQAHPCIARDGSYIIFDVQSGSYLYVSFKKQDGTWGEAIDLTAHGFDPMAGGATLSPDGKYLFFCLNDDIWWVNARVVDRLRPEK